MTTPRIIVAGAGPAGLAAGLELSSRGFAVTVCAARDSGRVAPGETLPASSRAALEHIGVWPLLCSDDCLALRGEPILQAWGSPDLAPHPGTAAPAWHICRRRFDATLLDKAMGRGVRVLRETTVIEVSTDADGCEVLLRGPDGQRQALRGDYLIDATGRRALVARAMGACSRPGSALVAVRTLWRDVAECLPGLMIESHPLGWAYAAPVPGGRIAAAILTDRDLLPRPVNSVWWRSILRDSFPHIAARLTGCEAMGRPTATAAHDGLTTLVMGERWIAVGDAAATFDPLASCGIPFAIGSAIYAARAVETALRGTPDKARTAYECAVARYCQPVRHRLLETYAAETRWPASPFWRRRHSSWAAAKRAMIAFAAAA
jgi:flavin-dependent dehydrogenase